MAGSVRRPLSAANRAGLSAAGRDIFAAARSLSTAAISATLSAAADSLPAAVSAAWVSAALRAALSSAVSRGASRAAPRPERLAHHPAALRVCGRLWCPSLLCRQGWHRGGDAPDGWGLWHLDTGGPDHNCDWQL